MIPTYSAYLHGMQRDEKKMVAARLSAYLELKIAFSNCRSGFRQHKSIHDQIIILVNDIQMPWRRRKSFMPYFLISRKLLSKSETIHTTHQLHHIKLTEQYFCQIHYLLFEYWLHDFRQFAHSLQKIKIDLVDLLPAILQKCNNDRYSASVIIRIYPGYTTLTH